MGAFRINPGYVESVLEQIQEAFQGSVGDRVVAEMKENTPVGKDRKSHRREVRVAFIRGEANNAPYNAFRGGGVVRFDESPESQAKAYKMLQTHFRATGDIGEKGKKGGGKRTIGTDYDVLAGMKSINFEPVSSKRLSSAMSRSIWTGSFMRTGKLEMKAGRFYAVHKAHKAGTLKNSITILDVEIEGKTVSLYVGNDVDEAPYGAAVEFGRHYKGDSRTGQFFMKETLNKLATEIETGSLLQGVIKG